MSNYPNGFYSLSDFDLVKHYNDAKDMVLEILANQNIITKEQEEDLGRCIIFIPVKKGLFGRAWDKLFGKLGPSEMLIRSVMLKSKQPQDQEDKP